MKIATVSSRWSWQNWWQNHACAPEGYFAPPDRQALVDLVQSAQAQGKTIKPVGSGHSWSDIPCTHGWMVSMANFNQILAIDLDQQTITAQAGVHLHEIISALAEVNLALAGLGSICEQTLAGALATGTHGTSLYLGSLSSAIVELEWVDGTGKIHACSRQSYPELFAAASLGLGALGIVTQVTLQAVPQFQLRESLETWRIEDVLENFTTLSQADYCRFWYTTHHQMAVVNRLERQPAAPPHPNQPLARLQHQIQWYAWIFKYYQTLKAGLPCFTRQDDSQYILCYPRWLLHIYKVVIDLTQSPASTLISEYGLPIEESAQALAVLFDQVKSQRIPGALRFEIRFGAASSSWLSPAYQRPTCYIQIVFEQKEFSSLTEQKQAFTQVEALMRDFMARPHWAKDHDYTHEDLKAAYPRWPNFLELCQQLDPQQLFRNAYLQRIFTPNGVPACPQTGVKPTAIGL